MQCFLRVAGYAGFESSKLPQVLRLSDLVLNFDVFAEGSLPESEKHFGNLSEPAQF